MGLLKYSSIENSYQNKYIDMFRKHYDQIDNETYIIQEKLDGANISLYFFPDGEFKIASRNKFIEKDENFFDVWNVIKSDTYKELIEHCFELIYQNNCVIIIYGELYGRGVQNRIDYGPNKYFSLFDMTVHFLDDDNITNISQFSIRSNPILSKYMVESYAIVTGLDTALEYKPDNFDEIEGVVIKPYFEVYKSPQGSVFYLKNKNPKFTEKEKKKPKVQKENKFSDEVNEMGTLFGTYVNENRVLSIFSKEGEIQDTNDIGKYIKLVLEDAKEDFFKENDFDETKFDKNELKYIFNHSGKIVNILKKYL